jgi:hypothetical protein
MHIVNQYGYLISNKIDPRFRPGVIVRGNVWATYNTTRRGTEWTIVKVRPNAVGPADPNTADLNNNFNNLFITKAGHPEFPVQAACFDFVSDPNLPITNRNALHLLRRW